MERIAALGDRVCPQFHVALQSGCDATLRDGPGYDTRTYRERIELIRSILPGAAITTDIIAGFPGESDADFEAAAAFAEEIAF
jgi:threonylcarbamoyladenosine tRNA methylthiotransferase MtaB